MNIKNDKKLNTLYLIFAYVGVMFCLYGVFLFNQYIRNLLPLPARLVTNILVYWFIAVIPFVVMYITKLTPHEIGFRQEKSGRQILNGVLFGVLMSVVLVLVPYFVGLGAWVDNGTRYDKLWKFVYEYGYCVLAIGAVEEIVFRGVIYGLLKRILDKEWEVMLISSVLFGFFHILNGNILQIPLTTGIGFIFCLIRYKVKNCSLMSLIILHGTYDFMITVFSSLLF